MGKGLCWGQPSSGSIELWTKCEIWEQAQSCLKPHPALPGAAEQVVSLTPWKRDGGRKMQVQSTKHTKIVWQVSLQPLSRNVCKPLGTLCSLLLPQHHQPSTARSTTAQQGSTYLKRATIQEKLRAASSLPKLCSAFGPPYPLQQNEQAFAHSTMVEAVQGRIQDGDGISNNFGAAGVEQGEEGSCKSIGLKART
jgi:hypothetical protein